MKFYKNSNDKVFSFESDGSQNELIMPDMVEMLPEEVGAHINPPPSQADLDNIAQAEDIAALQAATKDMAIVLIELIDYLLMATPMAATHFTVATRQKYQNIKVIAERVAGRE